MLTIDIRALCIIYKRFCFNHSWQKSSDMSGISDEGMQMCVLKIIPEKMYMGQVMELWLSCYLVLLSIDSKTR